MCSDVSFLFNNTVTHNVNNWKKYQTISWYDSILVIVILYALKLGGRYGFLVPKMKGYGVQQIVSMGKNAPVQMSWRIGV